MSLQAVIDKISKLRKLATSSNVNEAAAAAAAAEKLIQEHRLTEAELEQTSGAPAESIEGDVDPLVAMPGSQVPTWQWTLAYSLARLYGVALWVDMVSEIVKSETYPYTKRVARAAIRMVGRRSDVEITRYQFAYLTLEIERLTEAWAKGHKFAKGDGRRMRNGFRVGAVDGVIGAMKKASRDAMDSQKASSAGESAAMVLVNRAEESRAVMKKLYPNLRTQSGSPSFVNTHAYGEGNRAGASIHTGAALGSGSHRALGSGSK